MPMDPPDYYDVQAMIEKAVAHERAARVRHVDEIASELREGLQDEAGIRARSDATIMQVVNARTEAGV